MKRTGILNAQLAAALARLRHTDTFVVSDSGLPVPPEIETIDLAVVYGVPSFEVVVRAILAEIVVEAAYVSEPIAEYNPDCLALLRELYPNVEAIDHDDLKNRVSAASFVVRTGEAKPFANAVFRAGVPFFT